MVSINQVSNHVHRWPTGGFEESLAQLGERHVVHREDLSDIALSAAPTFAIRTVKICSISLTVIRSARRSLESDELVCNAVPDMSVQVNNELFDHVWDRV